MSKQITNQDQKGFTIIEVLIVLAIAALILLVVFLAIPGLQRSQRNSARKSDIGRITVSVSQFISANNGASIQTNDLGATCLSAYSYETSYTYFKGSGFTACDTISGAAPVSGLDSTTIGSSGAHLGSVSGLYVYNPNSSTTTVSPAATVSAAVVVFEPGFVCTSPNTNSGATKTSGASNTSVAIIYTYETVGGFVWNCNNA